MLILQNIDEVGVYELSFMMYIPAGRTGYFNIQGQTSPSGGAGNGGNGVFNSPNLVFNNTASPNGTPGLGGAYPGIADADPAYSWSYPEDAWFPISIVFEIAEQASESGWTLTVGETTLDRQPFDDDQVIGAIDFFALDANNEYFIDDVLFDVVAPNSVEELKLDKFSVYPNPVSDLLTIETSELVDEITIYNLLGSAVLNINPDNQTSVLDLSSFSFGMYLVEVRIDDAFKTIKITK